MGTISHHQTRADAFLHRADRAISTHDPTQVAVALRRAATHITTALAVHQGWKHKSQRQLEIVLHANIARDNLSRSHLKTLRQAHTLSRQTPSAPLMVRTPACGGSRCRPAGGGSSHEPVEPSPGQSPLPSRERAGVRTNLGTQLRRMRRRVASLISHAAALIAGRPKKVVHHKLWLRKPDLPMAPDFTCIQDILSLPNYLEIRQKFRLHQAPLDTYPDPHGSYASGDTPRRCQCHADLWNKPRDPNRITLSPPWRRALEKTFRIRLPNPLQLTC